jgi:hypothetical protein
MNEGMGEAKGEERVSITTAAKALVEDLIRRHGPLMFHQSGGCCDGSAPMCYPQGDFRIGERDVYLGNIAGCPFYMGADQHARWAHTHLTVDVVPGRGSGFSLEAPEGVRFIIRSRLLVNAESELEELPATSLTGCPISGVGEASAELLKEPDAHIITPSDGKRPGRS